MPAPGYVTPAKRGWWPGRTRKVIPTSLFLTLTGSTPSLGFKDTFTRANSATSAGPDWVNVHNIMGVSSNQAYGVTTTAVNNAYYDNWASTIYNQASAKFYGFSSPANMDCWVFMGAGVPTVKFITTEVFQDAGSWVACIVTSTAWDYSGQAVRATSAPLTVADGDTYSIERSGNIYIARQNGVARASWVDRTGFMPQTTATGMGIYLPGATNVSRIDDFSVSDVAAVPTVAKSQTLTDAFTTLDPAKWTYPAGTSIVSGRVNITAVGLDTVNVYDLTDSHISAECTQIGTTQTFLYASVGEHYASGGDWAGFDINVSGNTLAFHEYVDGVGSTTSITYNSTNHRWLRFRHSGSIIYWDTSPNGTTWTNQRSKTAVNDYTLVYPSLQSNAGTAIFDNFNL